MKLTAIGTIHTPFTDSAPFRPDESIEGEFYLELDPAYTDALYRLDSFTYIHILFYIDRPSKQPSLRVHPPRHGGTEVGLFASRSPHRFNSIGLSTIRIKKVEGNRVYTSCIDAFNGTPLLDIKPYIRDLDLKEDANMGWSEDD